MPNEYEIEMSEPSASHCDCCGGLFVRLTRFVYRNDDAFAIYYASYANNHPDNELAMLVSLGEWGEDSKPAQRTAFYCRVRPTKDSYEVMLGDATDSAWRGVEIVGEKLSREQALGHPWKATAFEVLDEAFVRELGRSFASLDGERFFVRCLLPVPVEGYGTWCIGFWAEVSKSDYDCVWNAWDDPAQYQTLRFSGVIANDVGAKLDLPVALGSKIQLHVRDPKSPPMLEAPATGELAELLSKTWAKAAFEKYAVARGFL